MRVDGGAKERNLARAERFIAQAASAGARVVLLPETLNAGWTHQAAHRDADPIPSGDTCLAMGAVTCSIILSCVLAVCGP